MSYKEYNSIIQIEELNRTVRAWGGNWLINCTVTGNLNEWQNIVKTIYLVQINGEWVNVFENGLVPHSCDFTTIKDSREYFPTWSYDRRKSFSWWSDFRRTSRKILNSHTTFLSKENKTTKMTRHFCHRMGRRDKNVRQKCRKCQTKMSRNHVINVVQRIQLNNTNWRIEPNRTRVRRCTDISILGWQFCF